MKNHNFIVGDYVKVVAHVYISDLSNLPPKFRFGKIIEIKKRWNSDTGRKLPDLITFRTAEGRHGYSNYSTLEKINIK